MASISLQRASLFEVLERIVDAETTLFLQSTPILCSVVELLFSEVYKRIWKRIRSYSVPHWLGWLSA